MRLEGVDGIGGCCLGVLVEGALVACRDGDMADDGMRDGASLAELSWRCGRNGGTSGETERAVTDAEWAR